MGSCWFFFSPSLTYHAFILCFSYEILSPRFSIARTTSILLWEERQILFGGANIAHTLSEWLSCKESAGQCRRQRRCGFDPWFGNIPWRRKWQPTPVFLPEKSHGQRSLAVYSPWDCKKLDTVEQLSTHTPCSVHTPCVFRLLTGWWKDPSEDLGSGE